MPHNVNRKSFLAAKVCGYPLLSAYGLLVATELALKDHFVSWRSGHDIPQMLDDLRDPGLTSLGLQLRLNLSCIPCTTKVGNQAMISSKNYPELRYTRHIGDLAGGTTDADLEKIIQVVDEIIVKLRSKGITV